MFLAALDIDLRLDLVLVWLVGGGDSLIFLLFFFFSSRRRHTRSKRDWSSDVCSSDLPHGEPHAPARLVGWLSHPPQLLQATTLTLRCGCRALALRRASVRQNALTHPKIGRASCRGRV